MCRYHITVIKDVERERHELKVQLAYLSTGKSSFAPIGKKTTQDADGFEVTQETKLPESTPKIVRPTTAGTSSLRGAPSISRPHSASSASSRASKRAEELQRILGKVRDRQEKQKAVPGEPEIWSQEKLNKLLGPLAS